MTTEEKAKRYDEAIERARKWYSVNTNEGYRGIFEDIFPELAESGDEKTRKELIELLNDLWEGKQGLMTDRKDYERYIAWLEKQGEQKPQRMVSAEAKEAMYNKPAWSEEDETIKNNISLEDSQ